VTVYDSPTSGRYNIMPWLLYRYIIRDLLRVLALTAGVLVTVRSAVRVVFVPKALVLTKT